MHVSKRTSDYTEKGMDSTRESVCVGLDVALKAQVWGLDSPGKDQNACVQICANKPQKRLFTWTW